MMTAKVMAAHPNPAREPTSAVPGIQRVIEIHSITFDDTTRQVIEKRFVNLPR